jgi:hypothetical protein
MICTSHQKLFEDQMKEDEMGGTCSAYRGEERCIQSFGGEPLGKETIWDTGHRWEDSIKVDHQEIEWNGVDWIDLSKDRVKWQAVVNAVMNLRVS